ncbi:glutamine--fructose-6-phosphate transaminase (isomerizing) [Natrinema salsiterrestre]|uniref:Glutamine--fructose-6-phosphate aminotransferase [isomerizing] n=1 Tax=Natrinema salsiterrestre TaxID=2950540 RepID=A0A9Q4PZC9_9EURY|nr:glutamine--fructose-6-phosphate transaminase (isomerizing) [Natrinema salsiterrestre]MDF9743984.1 glutamine--fructose-6-phosphate transaminase (isomerizing) [Natrinema salsiterrestre]
MCGIIGYASPRSGRNVRDVLLDGLSCLEYRGYDSAGVAVANSSIAVHKREGEVSTLEDALPDRAPDGYAGIGHTRWSTHGQPSDRNAHPHTDCDDRIAVVHNGIIENAHTLRDALEADGHTFTSETDTEVIPHLIEKGLDRGDDVETAFRRAVDRLEGSYAVAAVCAGHRTIYATRQQSPLVIGVDGGRYFLASDVPAFLEYTDDVIYLEDGQFAAIRPPDVEVTDRHGGLVETDVETVDWDPEDATKNGYDHYMLKEIREQPHALRKCLRGRVDAPGRSVSIDAVEAITEPNHVHFVACGTSYHASLYAARLFRERGMRATPFLASQYDLDAIPIGTDTLVVGVTQSGETADTVSALQVANDVGATTLTVTNVVGSSATREADHAMYIRAGPEISVAATKTFVSQQAALAMLSSAFSGECTREFVTGIRALPDRIQSILDQSRAKAIAAEYADADAYFPIGRGSNAAAALEGALKIKEITYKHAEGFPAGELKHGPLALVTDRTPVFAIVDGDSEAETMIGTLNEVDARGAPVIAVTDCPETIEPHADHVLEVPETDSRFTPILATVQLQLVSYWIANRLGRSIDKPRNLAKSVTVE